METLVHADLFFLITSAAVITLTILLAVLLIYLVKISHHLERFTRNISREGEKIIEDVHYVRSHIRNRALGLVNAVWSAISFVKSSKGKTNNRKTNKK